MSNPYEDEELLAQYLLFHYGSDDEVLPWKHGPREALRFAERTVHELVDRSSLNPDSRACDVGCAVGRSSFEMAAFCSEVIGIDFSASFVAAAAGIGAGETISYSCLDEGKLGTDLEARRPAGAALCDPDFQQGDAQQLDSAELGTFDLVHAANLVCRLPEPLRFLAALPDLVRPGGQLILATPATWLEEFTPRSRWPSGSMLEYLRESLIPAFELEIERDMPFLIRETARKFQWSVSLGTRWRRK